MLDNAIVKGVFKWGIFIKQQQYAFLPVYHIIPFSGGGIDNSPFFQIDESFEIPYNPGSTD